VITKSKPKGKSDRKNTTRSSDPAKRAAARAWGATDVGKKQYTRKEINNICATLLAEEIRKEDVGSRPMQRLYNEISTSVATHGKKPGSIFVHPEFYRDLLADLDTAWEEAPPDPGTLLFCGVEIYKAWLPRANMIKLGF